MRELITRKLGPLPVWAWLVAAIVLTALILWLSRNQSGASGAAQDSSYVPPVGGSGAENNSNSSLSSALESLAGNFDTFQTTIGQQTDALVQQNNAQQLAASQQYATLMQLIQSWGNSIAALGGGSSGHGVSVSSTSDSSSNDGPHGDPVSGVTYGGGVNPGPNTYTVQLPGGGEIHPQGNDYESALQNAMQQTPELNW